MAMDLSTDYLGLKLRSPLVASASPVSMNLESLVRLDECGAGAAVLPSLFAEQIEHEEMAVAEFYDLAGDAHAESTSYFPELDFYNAGRQQYLRHLTNAKQTITIPIIASLNCRGPGQWTREAKRLEDAGADALELNIYDVVTDPSLDGQQVEANQLRAVEAVRKELTIPMAVKIGPFYSSLPNFARRVVDAGANGLVLFNRYLEPDLNLEAMQVQPHLELSRPSELRLPLRWIAILRDHLSISLAATSGIHSGLDAIKVILAGADVAMMASTLLKHGPQHLASVNGEVQRWMAEHEYHSIRQMKGSMSRKNSPDPSGFERANYIKAIVSYV